MLSSGVRPEQSFYDSVKKQETEKTNMYRLNQVAIRMVEMPPLLSDVPMDGPEAAVKVMADMLKDYDREVVAIVNLQTDGKPINMNVVSMGALDQSIAHPREILKSTILSNASAIMLVHNHPSNKLQPSMDDIATTARVKQLCDLIGVKFLDHIIVGPGRDYYSFHQKQQIPLSSLKLTNNLEDIELEGFRVAENTAVKEEKKTVTLTVAECSEFHNMGEFHEKTDSTDSEEENEDKRGNAEMLACIAAMTNGRSYPLQNPKMEEGKTTPKKHFTEDSLLSAMERAGADEMPEETERKGIGTSATRAATIEKLVRIGFVERKGNKKTKYLMPTHKGVALITVMPEQIQSPSMTAEWEQKLLDVEKGNFQDTEFMSEIEDMITDLVKTYKVIEDAEVLMHPAMEEIGICPCCGQHVIERQKGYSCENRGCNFVLWKQNRFFEALGKKMTKQTAIKLLTDGKVALKGCKSKKTGNTYDTTVVMTVDENQRAIFELNFEKGEAKYGKGKSKKN